MRSGMLVIGGAIFFVFVLVLGLMSIFGPVIASSHNPIIEAFRPHELDSTGLGFIIAIVLLSIFCVVVRIRGGDHPQPGPDE